MDCYSSPLSVDPWVVMNHQGRIKCNGIYPLTSDNLFMHTRLFKVQWKLRAAVVFLRGIKNWSWYAGNMRRIACILFTVSVTFSLIALQANGHSIMRWSFWCWRLYRGELIPSHHGCLHHEMDFWLVKKSLKTAILIFGRHLNQLKDVSPSDWVSGPVLSNYGNHS